MFIYFICIYLYLCLYLYISLLMFMGLSYLCICFSVLKPPQDMDETRCTEGWQWYHGWGLHAMQSSTQSERWEDSFCPDSPYWCSNGWRVIETSCVWCLFFGAYEQAQWLDPCKDFAGCSNANWTPGVFESIETKTPFGLPSETGERLLLQVAVIGVFPGAQFWSTNVQ